MNMDIMDTPKCIYEIKPIKPHISYSTLYKVWVCRSNNRGWSYLGNSPQEAYKIWKEVTEDREAGLKIEILSREFDRYGIYSK